MVVRLGESAPLPSFNEAGHDLPPRLRAAPLGALFASLNRDDLAVFKYSFCYSVGLGLVDLCMSIRIGASKEVIG